MSKNTSKTAAYKKYPTEYLVFLAQAKVGSMPLGATVAERNKYTADFMAITDELKRRGWGK